jgi:hypothetical protein
MKRPLWSIAVLLASFALLDVSCTSVGDNPVRARTATRTFALAVTVNGGTQPSPEQWAALRATFAEMLAKRGYTLVDNPAHAANLVHVNFVTPPGDPLTGTAIVLSIEQAPPPLSIGYPGAGDYGPRRVSLASFDPVLARDRTIYLAPKAEFPSPSTGPDGGRL